MGDVIEKIMIAYKLLKKRKDGTLGPLFINCTQRLSVGQWIDAEDHPTKGYARRPGWHCVASKNAPHLSMDGRVWCIVNIEDFEMFNRPHSQGGRWLIAQKMKILGELTL